MTTNRISVEWVTNESSVMDFANALRQDGATIIETKGWMPGPEALEDYGDAMFEPLAAVALIVATGWLIRRIADVLDDVKRPGGELIDIRSERVIVRPLPRTKPPGKLVILTNEGAQVFLPDRRDEGLALLGELLRPVGG
jgi:hypothetical protein